LITSVAKPITLQGRGCNVTASIGMARVDKNGDAATALAAADAAMYRAKRLGRNHASL
jgi:GGDEF domain-containing protein